MAPYKYLAILVFLLFLNFQESFAQRHQKRKKNSERIAFSSVEVGIGMYKPFLNYWNQESFVKNWGTKFGAAPIFSGNAEFSMMNLINIRFEGQYWSNKASNYPSTTESGILSQEMSLRLVPIIGAVSVNLSNSEFIRTYIGAGGGLCFITNDLSQNFLDATRAPLHVTATGSGNMFVVMQGFDFYLNQTIRLGIETRYTFGSYDQSSAQTGTNSVALDGVQVLAKLAFTFNKKQKKRKFAF